MKKVIMPQKTDSKDKVTVEYVLHALPARQKWCLCTNNIFIVDPKSEEEFKRKHRP